MLNTQSVPHTSPIHVQGYHKEPYQQIIQPEQIWPVSKYFLRHWLGYLKPAEMWLIIAARQLSYRNQNCPWFRAYDETLAKGAGLNTQTFRRLRRSLDDTLLGQFLQADTQNRTYTKRNGRLRPAETRYTIRLDDPLTPAHTVAVTQWLKQNSPSVLTGETLQQLLQTAIETPDLLTQTETDTERPSAPLTLYTVSELIPILFGKEMLKSKQVWGETAVQLQRHITQPNRIHIESQYFRREWLPKLGPGPALLLVYLRSYSYYNEETDEQRDTLQFQTGNLETIMGISPSTLRRWLKKIQQATGNKNPIGSFISSLESKKLGSQQVNTTYKLSMHTPLIPEDVARYYQLILTQETPQNSSPSASKGQPHRQGEQTAVTTQTDSPDTNELAATQPVANNAHPIKWQKGNRDSYVDAKRLKPLSQCPNKQGSPSKCSPHNEGHEQNVHHIIKVTSKMFTTQQGWQAKSSPHNKGHEQNVQGSPSKCSPLKDSNYLIRSVKESIQSLNNKQQDNTYSVVAVGDVFGLMTQLEITGQARKTFQNSQLTLEQMMGWYLWASQQAWCQQPVAYTIQRVRQNEPPPALYQQFASLPWQTWQLYAVFQTARDLIDFPPETSKWSAFEAWGERFGHLSLDALPFRVGVGLETAVDRLLSASSSLIGSTQPSQPKKPVPNQATMRHPKSPSAPTWGGQQTVALPLMQAKTSRGQGELLLCEHPTPDLASVGRDTFAPTTDQLTLWQMTLHELALQLPKATFCNWLQGAKLMGVDGDGRFIVQLKNQYAKEWVDNRLAPTILRTWSALMGDEVTARFTC